MNLENFFFFKYRLQLIMITLLIVGIYGKILQFDYVGFDDKTLIIDNFKFINNLSNLKSAFTHDVFYNPDGDQGTRAYYRPLMTLSLMFDSQWGGQSPVVYHLTNLLLHIGCCFLLFRFFLLLKIKLTAAFTGVLLFAVHPILSQAIAWIPGRNDSLLMLFVLASLIYFIRFIETNKKWNLFLHIFFFLLAILTKEVAVFLPIIAFSYYFFIYRSNQKNEGLPISCRVLISPLLGDIIVLIGWYFIRSRVIENTIADLSFQNQVSSLMKNGLVYFQLIQKMIIPSNLSIVSTAEDINVILSIISVSVLIGFILISKEKRWNFIFFGFVWFNIFLLPSFVVPVFSGFEHRVYLPMIGFLLIVLEIDYFKSVNFNHKISLIPFGAIFSVFLVMNIKHTPAFADRYSFWNKAASYSLHSSLAQLNYAVILAEEGRFEEAIRSYHRILTLNPSEPMIHNNMGVIYARHRMFADAEREFKTEIMINPSYSDAYYNLGLVLGELGREAEMIALWKKALLLNPRHRLVTFSLDKYYQRHTKL